MGDRSLLERAAKAAVIDYYWEHEKYMRIVGKKRYWNSLTDDGDEARLEAACGLDVQWFDLFVYVGRCQEYFKNHNGDKQAARRRAGTRAAAELSPKE